MADKKINIGATDIILFVLSIIFTAGLLTLFGPCRGPKADGSWMSCRWAANAETGLAFVMTIISLLHLCIANSKVKSGLSLALMPAGILAALLPDHLVKLCMMETMRCHTIMHPAVTIISSAITIIAFIDVLLQSRKK